MESQRQWFGQSSSHVFLVSPPFSQEDLRFWGWKYFSFQDGLSLRPKRSLEGSHLWHKIVVEVFPITSGEEWNLDFCRPTKFYFLCKEKFSGHGEERLRRKGDLNIYTWGTCLRRQGKRLWSWMPFGILCLTVTSPGAGGGGGFSSSSNKDIEITITQFRSLTSGLP